jgi:hypothetical protein
MMQINDRATAFSKDFLTAFWAFLTRNFSNPKFDVNFA